MKTKLLFVFVLTLISNPSYSQDLNQTSLLSDSTIFVSEETLVPLPITSSSINFSISASGKNATEANSSLLLVKKKIETLTNSKLVIVNRQFSGGSGAGDKLSSATSILITEEITTIVSEESLPRVLDSLLPIPLLKITGVSPLKDNLFDLKTQESSRVVNLAVKKAAQIAKDQSMALGSIMDVTVTEEPSVASIREQLEPNGSNSLTNPTEIKIVTSLRIRLKQR